MFYSNHFITNFPQNAIVKKILKIGQYLTKIWTKLCSLLFGGPPCIFNVECNALVDMTKPLSLTVSEIYLGNR